MALHDPCHPADYVALGKKSFLITVRTGTAPHSYPAVAASAGQAAEDAAERFADVPCGITVTSGEAQ